MKAARVAMLSFILAGAISLCVSPGAAAKTIYYVVVDPITQLCTIVDAKPEDATRVVVTMSSLYIDIGREEAERGLRSIMGCTNYRARGA